MTPEETIRFVFRRQRAVAEQLDRVLTPSSIDVLARFVLLGRHSADIASIEIDRKALRGLDFDAPVDIGGGDAITRNDALQLIAANEQRAAPLHNFRGVLATDDK